jgi:hypothetical protein
MTKPWVRHAITGLIVVTLPIWFIPMLLLALAGLLVGGIYLDIHKRLWNR